MPEGLSPSNIDPDEPQPGERRAWLRYPCDLETSCHPSISSNETRWSARMLDISQGGIRLLVERRFELGTILNIQVESSAEDALPTLLARVVHVCAQPGGQWALGCRFGKELSEKDVAAYLPES